MAVLFLLLTSGIIWAQENEGSSNKTVPAATPKKRPDLNNLVSLTGQKAPDFILTDLNGTEYNLEKLRGKIVVINLWATWCVPCVEEIPELNALVNKFKNKDVVFLAATTEDRTVLEGFLQKNPFAYQILPGALDIMKKYSPKEKTESADVKPRTIQALPTHIVIDWEGMVIKHVWGFGGNKISELSQSIERLLAAQKQ